MRCEKKYRLMEANAELDRCENQATHHCDNCDIHICEMCVDLCGSGGTPCEAVLIEELA